MTLAITGDPRLNQTVELLAGALVKEFGARDAVALLTEYVAEQLPVHAQHACPAMGCCGCGAWLADVVFLDSGEMYCWPCIDAAGSELRGEYGVLPGRGREC